MFSKLWSLFSFDRKSEQVKSSTYPQGKLSFEDIELEIKRAKQFVPAPREMTKRPGFALATRGLEQYKRARKLDDKLPDLSVQHVQEKEIENTIDLLKRGCDLAIGRTRTPALDSDVDIESGDRIDTTGIADTNEANGSKEPSSTSPDFLIPRTIKVHFDKTVLEKYGGTSTETDSPDAEVENKVEVKFKDIKRLLVPPKSITVPENPVTQLLRQKISSNHGNTVADSTGTTSGPGEDDNSAGLTDSATETDSTSSADSMSTPDSPNTDDSLSTDGSTDKEESVNADDAFLRGKVQEILKKSEGKNAAHPYNFEKSRPKGLYSSVDSANQHLESAADTVAYYDFYDLKIAWRPTWSEAVNIEAFTADYERAPAIVARFVPRTSSEQWRRYIVFTLENDIDWREIERAAAEYAIFGVYIQIATGNDEIDADLYEKLEGYAEIAGRSYADVEQEADTIRNGRQIAIRVQLGEAITQANILLLPEFEALKAQYQRERDNLQRHWYEKLEIIASQDPGPRTIFAISTHNVGYEFPIFAPGSVNYGILTNYRQRWSPKTWQVGDLVKTIPLAPKESRKYTKKLKITKKRSRKEIENALSSRRSEDATNTRAESEIVERAKDKTSFNQTVGGSGGVNIFGIGADVNSSTAFNTEAASDSADSKKKFRESVAKSAREMKDERKVEVVEEDSIENELTTNSEISNPNEEITVTYLFYELQRRYEVSENLHSVEAVMFVANEIPSSDEINWNWILRYDWILKRVLLDDSFKPALDYVLEGKKAMKTTVDALEDKKKQLIEVLKSAKKKLQTLEDKDLRMENELQAYSQAIFALTSPSEDLASNLWEEIFGGGEGSKIDAYEGLTEDTVERLERATQRLTGARDEVAMQRNALDRAVDAYNSAVQARSRKIRNVVRLVQHIQDNILYYMQAIWSHEPPDQRYLRLFDREVPFFDYPPDDEDVIVRVLSDDGTFNGVDDGVRVEVVLPPPTPPTTRRLDDVADLNNLLGFKGNYMVFPLRRQSYITAYMMQSFIGGLFGPDPSDASHLYLDQALDPAASVAREIDSPGISLDTANAGNRLYGVDPDVQSFLLTLLSYAKNEPEEVDDSAVETELDKLIRAGKLIPERPPEEIIVPTDSLYIEALPGKHALLEDFKLNHRMIDVQKALVEHRAMVLENARAEVRLWKLDLDDPEVDKHVVIDGQTPWMFNTSSE